MYLNRLTLLNNFKETKTNPCWLTIKYLPVLPPNLRPIVKLQDKRIIVTDLNLLYSNIINSNNKIKKLRNMHIPEKYLSFEKNILQIKIDQLIENKKIKVTNKNFQNILKLFQKNTIPNTLFCFL